MSLTEYTPSARSSRALSTTMSPILPSMLRVSPSRCSITLDLETDAFATATTHGVLDSAVSFCAVSERQMSRSASVRLAVLTITESCFRSRGCISTTACPTLPSTRQSAIMSIVFSLTPSSCSTSTSTFPLSRGIIRMSHTTLRASSRVSFRCGMLSLRFSADMPLSCTSRGKRSDTSCTVISIPVASEA